MICESCRVGGDLNRQIVMESVTTHEAVEEALAEFVEPWHAGCPGGTHCDCQHGVGKWTQ